MKGPNRPDIQLHDGDAVSEDRQPSYAWMLYAMANLASVLRQETKALGGNVQ